MKFDEVLKQLEPSMAVPMYPKALLIDFMRKVYDEGFKDCAKARLNVTTISDCPIKDDWHRQEIEDIYDLIAEDWSIKYFICIMKDKSRVTAIGNCDEGYSGEVSVNLFFDHDDEKYHIDDIVWWKEIVLPKESE